MRWRQADGRIEKWGVFKDASDGKSADVRQPTQGGCRELRGHAPSDVPAVPSGTSRWGIGARATVGSN